MRKPCPEGFQSLLHVRPAGSTQTHANTRARTLAHTQTHNTHLLLGAGENSHSSCNLMSTGKPLVRVLGGHTSEVCCTLDDGKQKAKAKLLGGSGIPIMWPPRGTLALHTHVARHGVLLLD